MFELLQSTQKYSDMAKFGETCCNWLGLLVTMGPDSAHTLLSSELFVSDSPDGSKKHKFGELSPPSKALRQEVRRPCFQQIMF